MALAIGAQQAAGIVQVGPLADAGHDIVQRPLFAGRIECIVRREQRNADPVGQGLQSGQAPPVRTAVLHRRAEP